MSGAWVDTPLRRIATSWCDGPFGSSLASEHYTDGGARVVRLQNIRASSFDSGDAAFIDPNYFNNALARHSVLPGDLLVAGLGDDNNLVGRACVAPDDLGPALVKADCFRFRLDPSKAESRFVAYSLSAFAGKAAGELSGGSTRSRINLGTMAGRKVPLPCLVEQERIANFLDEQTARINALIAEKSHLAQKVCDYERAELARLVETGLRGSPLKKTGSNFVPVAPDGWRVAAFKRALQGMEQGWSPQCESRPAESHEWGVLKVGCVNGLRFDPLENKALPPELQPDMSCVLRKGDVLVSRANTRELVGSAALVWGDFPNLLLCDKLYRLRIRTDWLLPEYAVLVLRSESARQQIELGASGASSSMQNISQDVLRELVVAVPPLSEQVEILQRAKAVQMNCEDLVAHIDQHIDRLREYRSSLISAAVTGQLDFGALKEVA